MNLNNIRGPAALGSADERGFTLVEVLVALVITAIGLLGIAKIQALAYSSTGTSSMRSLAAIEGSSLASMMRANRAYWAATVAPNPPNPLTITTTISDTTLNGLTTNCAGAYCDVQTLAAYDLHQWATAVNTLLVNPTTTIGCAIPPGASLVECKIDISWQEKNVAVNAQGGSMAPQTYTLYVEP